MASKIKVGYEKNEGCGLKGNTRETMLFLYPLTGSTCKRSTGRNLQICHRPAPTKQFSTLSVTSPQMPVREKRKRKSQVKDERKVPHATCQLRPSQENQHHLLPGSILSVFRRDLCLFMDHYFGHWHVRVLLFGLFNCLSQRLSPGNHRRAKTKRRRNMHDQQQGGDLWARSIYTIYKWDTMIAKGIIHCILES